MEGRKPPKSKPLPVLKPPPAELQQEFSPSVQANLAPFSGKVNITQYKGEPFFTYRRKQREKTVQSVLIRAGRPPKPSNFQRNMGTKEKGSFSIGIKAEPFGVGFSTGYTRKVTKEDSPSFYLEPAGETGARYWRLMKPPNGVSVRPVGSREIKCGSVLVAAGIASFCTASNDPKSEVALDIVFEWTNPFALIADKLKDAVAVPGGCVI